MRFTKKRIIGGAVTLVLVAGTATAWYVASSARTSAQIAADSAPPDETTITATAEDRELLELIELEGELQQADELKVSAPAGSGGGGDSEESNSGLALVSALPMKTGDAVNTGSVLIEINGRPLFALPGNVGAYRDLGPGDQGPDVEQLQKALSYIFGTPVTGTFDSQTSADVKRLYQNAGYQAAYKSAGGSGDNKNDEEDSKSSDEKVLTVPASELYFVPELPVTVGKIKAKLGAPAEDELMKLVSGKWQVVAEIDDKTASALAKLKKSTPITFTDGPLKGKKAGLPEIVEPKKDESQEDDFGGGEESKQQAIFTVKDTVTGAQPGDAQSVTAERVKSPEGSLVVPASAVWTASDGTEKVTVVDGKKTRDVVVKSEVDYNGEIAVTVVKGDLSDGDKVVVAKRDEDSN